MIYYFGFEVKIECLIRQLLFQKELRNKVPSSTTTIMADCVAMTVLFVKLNADSGLVGSWFDEDVIKTLDNLDSLQYEEIKDLSNAAGRTFRENVKA